MLKADYYLKFESKRKIFNWLKSRIDRREPVWQEITNAYPAGSKLLDVGCGVGRFLGYAKKHFQCTGIDLSSQAIKIARLNNPQIKLIVGDISDPKVAFKEKYHLITAFDVLEHVNQPSTLLKRMSLLSVSGGSIIFSVPRKETLSYRLAQGNWWALADPGHRSLLNTAGWKKEIKAAGLTIVKEYSSGIINYPEKPYKLGGGLLVLHALTQTAAVFGLKLPNFLNDLIIWECKPI